MNWAVIGAFLCATGSERGEVGIPMRPRMLNLTAPAPYTSGTFVDAMHTDTWTCDLFPSPETASLPFEERMALAFRQAITQGVDLLGGLPSVLAGLASNSASAERPAQSWTG